MGGKECCQKTLGWLSWLECYREVGESDFSDSEVKKESYIPFGSAQNLPEEQQIIFVIKREGLNFRPSTW